MHFNLKYSFMIEKNRSKKNTKNLTEMCLEWSCENWASIEDNDEDFSFDDDYSGNGTGHKRKQFFFLAFV